MLAHNYKRFSVNSFKFHNYYLFINGRGIYVTVKIMRSARI